VQSTGEWAGPDVSAAWRLSALVGAPYIGSRIEGLREIPLPILSGLPVIGPILFNYDFLVYLAIPMAFLGMVLLFSTRWD